METGCRSLKASKPVLRSLWEKRLHGYLNMQRRMHKSCNPYSRPRRLCVLQILRSRGQHNIQQAWSRNLKRRYLVYSSR